jgi:hypothetical protein
VQHQALHLVHQPADLPPLRFALALQLVQLAGALQIQHVVLAQLGLVLIVQAGGRLELRVRLI